MSLNISYSSAHLFNGKKDDFTSWKQLVQSQLAQHNVWDGVTINPADNVSTILDAKAQNIIRSLMTHNEAGKLGLCTSAKDLWVKLQENYEGSKEHIIRNAGRSFMSFKAKKGESILELCGRYETLIGRLEAVDHRIGEGEKIEKFKEIIPRKAQDYAKLWILANKKGTLTELIREIKEEFEYDDPIEESNDKALMATQTRNQNKSRSKNKQHNGKPNDNHQSGSNENKEKKKYHCNHCGLEGHTWRYCKKLITSMKEKKSKEADDNEKPKSNQKPDTLNWSQMAVATFEPRNQSRDILDLTSVDNESIEIKQINDYIEREEKSFMAIRDMDWCDIESSHIWMADSGATSHMTGSIHLLDSFEKFDPPRPIMTAGKLVEAIGCGDFYFLHEDNYHKGVLHNVLLVEDLPVNLFSLFKVWKEGYDIIFSSTEKSVLIKDENKTVLIGSEVPNFLVAFNLKPAKSDIAYFTASMDEWHKRFAHSPTVKDLVKSGMVSGMKINRQASTMDTCVTCLLGKLCRAHHPTRMHLKASPLVTILHFDTAGKFTIESANHESYAVVCVDEYSGFRIVEFCETKADIKTSVKNIINLVEIQTKKNVKVVATDNGSEYVNKELDDWLKNKTILHEVSAPYTPEQNGKIERTIRSVKEAARTLMIESKLPLKLWSYACSTAVYALNRTPSPNDSSKTRFELFLGRKPDVSNLKVFGQYAVILKPKTNQDKWGPKGRIVRFIGYTRRSNTFDFYDEESDEFITSCDVRFLSLDYKNQATKANNEQTGPIIESDNQMDTEELINVDLQSDISDLSDQTKLITDNTFIVEKVNHNNGVIDDLHKSDLSESQSKSLAINESDSIDEIAVVTDHQITKRPRKAEGYFIGMFATPNLALFTVDGEPDTFKQAVSGPNKIEWNKAIKEELDSLHKNNTWTVIDKPKNCKTIGSKWIFKNKLQTDGSMKRKARLVATGYTQQYGIDYNLTYAPVAMIISIRLLLILATKFKMYLRQFDVKTAFLNGDLEENILLRIPEGLDIDREKKALKLNKSLYGLKQSPRQWNKKFDFVIKKFGPIQSNSDP